MILLESGVGEGESKAGIPQIEALLSRLPLGLAMCERDGRFLFAGGEGSGPEGQGRRSG